MRTWWMGALVLASMTVPTPASALSCMPLSDQEPHSSFTGTVVEKRGDAYLFVVREVWSGPELQERTWIRFDRIWHDPVPAVGEPWVIYADESFRANACTVRPDEEGARDLRPAKVREPVKATWWSTFRTGLIGTYMLVPLPLFGETD